MTTPGILDNSTHSRNLFRTANDACFVFDYRDLSVVDANPTAERLTDFDHAEICALRLGELFSASANEGLREMLAAFEKADFFHSREGYFLKRKSKPPLAVNVTLTRWPDHPDPFGLVAARDVHERRRLVDSLQLLQFSVDQSSIATFWLGKDARFLHVNQAACRALGYTQAELLQKRVQDIDPLYPAVEWSTYWRELKSCGSKTFVSQHRHRDGRMIPVEITVKYLEYAGQELQFAYAQDITERVHADLERRRLEERVLQAQKLESMGMMAGGIAHDFNNLLTVILGNAQLLQGRLGEDSSGDARVQEIITASDSAAGLCKQLLAYSGKCNLMPVATTLDEVVRRQEFLPPPAGLGPIRRHQFLAEPAPVVQADVDQLAQAVAHLHANAVEALGPEGGTITITTGTVHADRHLLDQAALGAGLPEGPAAFLEVNDTGCGMDAATRAKMFEPFFSTKFIGRGLGLAFVFGIMRGHRGAIWVRSHPGQGTSVRLLLPLPIVTGSTAPSAPLTGPVPLSAKGTILVVEDEAAIRELVRHVLELHGYQCILASDGMEALHIFKAHQHDIDLVFLDLTMPRLGGEATFHQLRAISPVARVILCTGYDAQQSINRLLVQNVAGILQKPYTPAQMLDLLETALSAARLV